LLLVYAQLGLGLTSGHIFRVMLSRDYEARAARDGRYHDRRYRADPAPSERFCARPTVRLSFGSSFDFAEERSRSASRS
jgi:hypothetical protein